MEERKGGLVVGVGVGGKLLQIVLGVHAGTREISVRNIYTISVNGKHWNQNGAKPRLVSSIFAACVYIKSPLTIMMGKGRCRRLLWLYMYTVVVVHVHCCGCTCTLLWLYMYTSRVCT